eukprot:IDg11037t1
MVAVERRPGHEKSRDANSRTRGEGCRAERSVKGSFSDLRSRDVATEFGGKKIESKSGSKDAAMRRTARAVTHGACLSGARGATGILQTYFAACMIRVRNARACISRACISLIAAGHLCAYRTRATSFRLSVRRPLGKLRRLRPTAAFLFAYRTRQVPGTVPTCPALALFFSQRSRMQRSICAGTGSG